MTENRNESEFDFLQLLFGYIVRRLNFQHCLFFSVFVTFDIGDAVTASMMIESNGIGAEYNMIVRYIFVNYGLAGLIAAKLVFIIVPLIIASMVVKRSYWFINGVLVALIIAGLMATQANLQKLGGLPHLAPVEINLIYIKALFIFAIAGTVLDHYLSDPAEERFPTR